ncbi:DEAD/DEAH box helicase [Alicyclobacillus acidiphilus]|uniref:DEAD/DEAH box helicase n=1 Tax=Alicyclobacillus acidiphilus TaxID=182455 RepID=UPI000AD309D1|nr:SNF2-related protein [Alicyclobacillus acidiphilus]
MAERYFFQLLDALLELDALEMDKSLCLALRDIPTQGQVLVFVSRDGAKVSPESPFFDPIPCVVDHDARMLIGSGLGKALSEFSGQSLLVAERTSSTSGVASTAALFVYPPPWLLDGVKSRTATGDGGLRVPNDGAVTYHVEQAGELVELLARLPAVSTREVDLHQQAVRLSLRSGFEELLSLKLLHEITPFPHQIRTVERVLRRMRGRALLCDEVGLGKTIEAGIVMTEYLLRGLVKRVLILTPPSLVEQWKEEVTRKLGLAFVCYDEARFKAADKPWQTFEHIIASLDTAKREPHRDEILATEFDLVIVDEAHHLKNKSTLAWKFVNQLKKKYILLLTATPIENDMSELFNLITLLKPGQLLTEAEYKRRFIDKSDPLQPKNVAELKKLVQGVMIRNRRSTTGVIHSTRSAETILVPQSPDEQLFYTRLSQFVKDRLQAGVHAASRSKSTELREDRLADEGRTGGLQPFVVKQLLRQAGSSAACVLATLRKSLSIPGIQEVIDIGERIRMSGKEDALLKIVKNTPDQVVVFTGFVETQHAVSKFLEHAGLDVVTFHGGMSRAQKEQSIEKFRAGVKVLVSTESGGEGRNLQFCHCMVNYDIPWNPMRIEQRIGRIHRIGQQQDVTIYNLAAKGTMEEHILRILDAKVNLFQLVIGELDMILGTLDEKREFEDILMDIWLKAKDEDELVQGVEQLGDELLAAKTHYQKVRDLDDRLLSELIENE